MADKWSSPFFNRKKKIQRISIIADMAKILSSKPNNSFNSKYLSINVKSGITVTVIKIPTEESKSLVMR